MSRITLKTRTIDSDRMCKSADNGRSFLDIKETLSANSALGGQDLKSGEL